jgi:hypothetical protein
MAKGQRPRYLPPQLGKRDHERAALIPRWFMREAVPGLGLGPFDVAAFLVIADNLDANGVSTTAKAVIAERGGMSRRKADAAVDHLIHTQVIFRLDEVSPGRTMRYSIAAECPWIGA